MCVNIKLNKDNQQRKKNETSVYMLQNEKTGPNALLIKTIKIQIDITHTHFFIQFISNREIYCEKKYIIIL